jgi:hypothetical protein
MKHFRILMYPEQPKLAPPWAAGVPREEMRKTAPTEVVWMYNDAGLEAKTEILDNTLGSMSNKHTPSVGLLNHGTAQNTPGEPLGWAAFVKVQLYKKHKSYSNKDNMRPTSDASGVNVLLQGLARSTTLLPLCASAPLASTSCRLHAQPTKSSEHSTP